VSSIISRFLFRSKTAGNYTRFLLNKQHDVLVTKIGVLNDDYIIETNRRYGVYDEYKFKFKNFSLIKDITKSGRLTWNQYEIYLRDNGYEIHILFTVYLKSSEKSRKINLTDLIIFAEDIEIETITHEPEEYCTEFL
jgi:hypothetical protein